MKVFFWLRYDKPERDHFEKSGVFTSRAPQEITDLEQHFVCAGLYPLATSHRMVERAMGIQQAAADDAPQAVSPFNFDRQSMRRTAVRDVDSVDGYSAWHAPSGT